LKSKETLLGGTKYFWEEMIINNINGYMQEWTHKKILPNESTLDEQYSPKNPP
jgi:hypothetical protein